MSRVQVRCGELPALRTVQARRAIREKELGPHMIALVGNKQLIKVMTTVKGMHD